MSAAVVTVAAAAVCASARRVTGCEFVEERTVGSKLVTTWTSPTGQRLHSVKTSTDPSFVFAYNPLDMDMARMAKRWVLEPAITLAWSDAARSCCRGGGAQRHDVVDVGANFGWFSLFSAALGCQVLAFEPVPAWNEAFALGIALNRGFARRVRVVKRVVHGDTRDVALHVPRTDDGRSRFLGMTYMNGSAGKIKGYAAAETYVHVAKTARVDDYFQGSSPTPRVCVFKADVEGYEPQVFATARRLFLSGQVQHVHMEMTRPSVRQQSCAGLQLLDALHELGFVFAQSTHAMVDAVSLPVGPWSGRLSNASAGFLPFPSKHALTRARRRQTSPMSEALTHDFTTFSTNLVGRLGQRATRSRDSWPATASCDETARP
jgi:FkbM family methyltransferase